MRDPLAHVGLGVDDVVGADTLEDLSVLAGDRLGPDLTRRRASTSARTVRTLASMSVPMATTARSKSPDAELAQGLVVGAVGAHHVGELVSPSLDQSLVRVDGEDLVAEPDQATRPQRCRIGRGR